MVLGLRDPCREKRAFCEKKVNETGLFLVSETQAEEQWASDLAVVGIGLSRKVNERLVPINSNDYAIQICFVNQLKLIII